MTTVYVYRNCSTCRKALAWLEGQGIDFDERPIRETPPSVAELRHALAQVGDLRRLFNTSGMEYRALGLKEHVSRMNEDAALRLLASNGMLVKRPLVIGEDFALAGFQPDVWSKAFRVA